MLDNVANAPSPELYDMWKENVAGYERIEGERKLTQTEKVKKKESSCPTSHRSERKEGKKNFKDPHTTVKITITDTTTPEAGHIQSERDNA